MTENPSTLTEAEPFEIVTEADETDGEYVAVEYTAYPSAGTPDAETDLSHARWAADTDDEHVNPRIEEYFRVISGEFKVVVEGQERLLTDGEDVTIQADRPHRHWNPSDEPARIHYEARPAIQMGEALETAFVLGQAGEVDERGLPTLLPMAVFQDAHPDHFYSTDAPIVVQKAMFKLLAPVGRLAGYQESYSLEDVDSLR